MTGNGVHGAVDPTRERWRITFWSVAALILMLPALAMQFTTEVAWGVEDFLAAAVLLTAAGLALELVLRAATTLRARLLGAGLVLLAGALIWAELAVGLVG